MKRIVITGGSGFIGSHLCDRFISKKYEIICIDNLITGDIENVNHLLDNPLFRFVNHDVSQYIDITENVDYVLHFASPASPTDYAVYPIQTLKVGALGTHNSLGLSKDKNAVFLLASTSEVYGDPLEHPQKETYWGNVNPIGPRGVYDEAKRFAEAITMAYHRVHKVNVKIIRIFNTFGPRMRLNDGRAIPNFITQALRGEPLTVYGDGNQTRSFQYIDDLIDGITNMLDSNCNDPVNLGNPKEMSLNKLAEIIIELTGSQSKIKYFPLPEDDPKVRCPDIKKAKEELQWEPKVEIKEALMKTIQYFDKKLSGK